MKRIHRLLSLFKKNDLDALLVSSWPNVRYMSGFRNTESWLLISSKGRYLITDSRYFEQAKREAMDYQVILRDKKSVPMILKELAHSLRLKKMGFEAPIVTYEFYKELIKHLGNDHMCATSGLIEAFRLYKDPDEILDLKKSAKIAVKGFCYLRGQLKAGMSENQALAVLEYHTKTLGAEKPSFDIIIASGAGSSMPHYQTGHKRFKKNDMVLVDMGVVYNGFCSDLTRPIFLGKMTGLRKKVFDIVWRAQRAGIKKAGPGVPASEVDAASRLVIEEAGYGKYFGHGTGHGVGLEIHEAPTVSGRSKAILEPGIVITVEPGIYLPGQFGVRIEDMILITKNGNEVLTKGLDS